MMPGGSRRARTVLTLALVASAGLNVSLWRRASVNPGSVPPLEAEPRERITPGRIDSPDRGNPPRFEGCEVVRSSLVQRVEEARAQLTWFMPFQDQFARGKPNEVARGMWERMVPSGRLNFDGRSPMRTEVECRSAICKVVIVPPPDVDPREFRTHVVKVLAPLDATAFSQSNTEAGGATEEGTIAYLVRVPESWEAGGQSVLDRTERVVQESGVVERCAALHRPLGAWRIYLVVQSEDGLPQVQVYADSLSGPNSKEARACLVAGFLRAAASVELMQRTTRASREIFVGQKG